jgi:hypothetical protein
MDYVHGYSARRTERLKNQACTLEELRADTTYSASASVLEAG